MRFAASRVLGVPLLPVAVLIAVTAAGAGASPAGQGFSRPMLVLTTYSPTDGVKPGSTFALQFRLANSGDVKARNIVVNIGGAEFIPAGTGGVIAAPVPSPLEPTRVSSSGW